MNLLQWSYKMVVKWVIAKNNCNLHSLHQCTLYLHVEAARVFCARLKVLNHNFSMALTSTLETIFWLSLPVANSLSTERHFQENFWLKNIVSSKLYVIVLSHFSLGFSSLDAQIMALKTPSKFLWKMISKTLYETLCHWEPTVETIMNQD